MSFISLLLPDVSAYVSMYMELPEYYTFAKLKAFAVKYVKVMLAVSAHWKKSTYLVEHRQAEPEEGEQYEDELEDYEGVENLEVDQRIEVLAFMRARGFQPSGRAATRRFQWAPGGRGQASAVPRAGVGAAREVPPRGRTDITCMNCGRKGHAAGECRQPRKEKHERPCF